MKAAILCPGPSLTKTWPPGGGDYALTIAVNRAIMVHPCDWWMFIDAHTYRDWHTYCPANARLCTTHEAEHKIGRNCNLHDDFYRRVGRGCWTDDLQAIPRDGWTIYSATCAQALAHHLGATAIDVYGSDMCGVADFDGHTSELNNRQDTRWESEAGAVAKIDGWLIEHGITVNRIRLNGPA